MARGWESKEIESQMDAARERQTQPRDPQLTPEQILKQRERESIELSRTRVLQDLAAAKNPRYRALLEESLKFLDAKLADLDTSSPNP